MYESAKAAAVYTASFGPYAVACVRMSRAEWRHAIKHGWDHFKDEMSHYWMGTKLLWVEVKIASRLLFKTLRGEQLTRRERRQMTRTTADVFRLVPFAAFLLIPFMELVPEQRRELGDVVVGNRGVARSYPFHKVVQLIRLVAGVPAPGLL